MGSYLSREYLRLSQCNQLDLNSNSTIRCFIHYTIQTPYIKGEDNQLNCSEK